MCYAVRSNKKKYMNTPSIINYGYVKFEFHQIVDKTQNRSKRSSIRMISDRDLHNPTTGMIFRSPVPFCNRMSKFSVHAHLLHDIISQLINIFSAKADFFISAISGIYVK